MVIIGAFCLLLPVLTTLIHYEVLRGLTASLARLEISARVKPIIAMVHFPHLREGVRGRTPIPRSGSFVRGNSVAQ